MRLSEARQRIADATHLNAFITLLDDETDRCEVVGVKDSVDIAGTVTTVGSAAHRPAPATVDAPLVAQIRSHGGAIVGKTNLHEWAIGLTSDNRHFGVVHNPRDVARIPGGSSGGSAAAVAASLCDWAVGADTGGSIIVPGALCGVVGYKPTFGLVDSTGTSAVSASLDTVGALAPSLHVVAHAAEMMTGRIGLLPHHVPDFSALKVAVPDGWVGPLDDSYRAAWAFVSARLPTVAVPSREDMHRTAVWISLAEAAAAHREWIDSSDAAARYTDDVMARLQIGLAVPAPDYIAALGRQRTLAEEFEAAMGNLDALVLPATCSVAPLIGEAMAYDLSYYCRPFNLTGQPTITVPIPTPGLPLGVMVVGRRHGDAELLAVAAGLEDYLKTIFSTKGQPGVQRQPA